MQSKMGCDRCGEKAVYLRRYSGQRFCKDHFIEYIERKVEDTVKSDNATKRGSRIGVGLSGGKDSITTLYILKSLEDKLDFNLQAITVDEGIAEYRESGVETAEKVCDTLDIPLHLVSFKEEFGKTLDEMTQKGDKGPCTYCGVFRRRLLNKKAKELGLDLVATGHNLDDEAQSILMNYLQGDIERLARLGRGVNDKGLVKRIKPLREIPEKEIALYAILKDFKVSFDECPYAQEGFRTKIRDFLNDLELDHSGLKFSVLRGYERMNSCLDIGSTPLKTCIICGEPSPNKICKVCSLLSELDQSLK